MAGEKTAHTRGARHGLLVGKGAGGTCTPGGMEGNKAPRGFCTRGQKCLQTWHMVLMLQAVYMGTAATGVLARPLVAAAPAPARRQWQQRKSGVHRCPCTGLPAPPSCTCCWTPPHQGSSRLGLSGWRASWSWPAPGCGPPGRRSTEATDRTASRMMATRAVRCTAVDSVCSYTATSAQTSVRPYAAAGGRARQMKQRFQLAAASRRTCAPLRKRLGRCLAALSPCGASPASQRCFPPSHQCRARSAARMRLGRSRRRPPAQRPPPAAAQS